jgi:hypothetical protein
LAERNGMPHFTHRAANKLNRLRIPHDAETDDIVGLWQDGLSIGLVTAYRHGIAHKLTVTLILSADEKSITDVELLT